MHDVVLIEYLEGIDELLEYFECFLFLDDSIFAEYAFKSAPVAVLVDEVEVVGSLEHVYVLDDVLILLYIGQDIDFVDGAFL